MRTPTRHLCALLSAFVVIVGLIGLAPAAHADDAAPAAVPTATHMFPQFSPTTGLMLIQITGANLTEATHVSLGGTPVLHSMVFKDGLLVQVAPHAAGKVDLTVTNGPGETTTLANAFEYLPDPLPAPNISNISPPVGPTTGGTVVRINGTGLAGGGLSEVRFGDTEGTIIDNFSDMINVRIPPNTAGPLTVTFKRGDEETATHAFTYRTPPGIISVEPAQGTVDGGEVVTIEGHGLADVTAVEFGGVPAASITPDTPGRLYAETPEHDAGAVDLVVKTAVGSTTERGAYTFVGDPAPTITSVTPSSGAVQGGEQVTLTGTHLAGATAVTFGGTAATQVTAVDAHTVTARAPAHAAGTVAVAVTGPRGTGTLPDAYTYVAPTPPPAVPTVTGVLPTQGTTAGGQRVIVTGTSLTGATALTFGGTSAAGVQVVNATMLTAVTPAHAAGKVAVAVTTAGGTGAKADAYTYVAPTPPAPTPPAAPVGVSYSPGGKGKQPATTVMWRGPSDATGYEVQAGDRTICTPEAARCVVDRLLGPKTTVKVRSLGSGGTKSAWATASYRNGGPGVELGTVRFAANSAALTKQAKAILSDAAAVLAQQGFRTVTITGHTDIVPGTTNRNHGDKIARDRAKAARDHLAKRLTALKAKAVTITVVSRGDRDPVSPNKTKSGRAKNRRAVFSLP